MQTESQKDGAEGTLPTALDVAREKSKLDPTPVTSGFWHRLRNNIRLPHGEANPALDEGGKAVAVTAQTVEAILFNSLTPVCSGEDLECLSNFEAKMLATIGRLDEFSGAKVGDYMTRRRDETASALTNGGVLPSDVVLPSREAVAHDFRVKQQALNSLLLKTTHAEVVPLAKPILQKFEKVVETFMREQEEQDRSMCAGFGLDYRPSLIWKAAASVAIQYQASHRLPRSHAWALPSSILHGFTLNQ